jgi:TM2 domain-containing membrane protein YozV
LADSSNQVENARTEQSNQAGIAAVLSLVVPGVGQIYNGDFLRGIFWLIITPGFWIWTAGLFGWPFHLIAAYTAYRRGKQYERGELSR